MTNIETLQQLVLKKITSFQNINKFYIGFSGGADSHVLLQIAADLRDKGYIKDLAAIHINHGINEKSLVWEKHCKSIAKELNIPCHTTSVKIDTTSNLEQNARIARYQEFARIIKENEALLLAHHLDDQIETILMRLFKGTGPRGICGIKENNTINNIQVIRPLLDIPKSKILEFADKKKLNYIKDPSNNDTDIDRNYIRHNIIPSIKDKWPDAPANIIRSIAHIESQEQYISKFCSTNMQKIVHQNKLSITALKEYSQEEQNILIRAWIIENNTYSPSTKMLKQIFNELIYASEDKCPIIKIQDIELRRFKNYIYLLPIQDANFDLKNIVWQENEKTIYIPGIHKTLARSGSHMFAKAELTIKFRSYGEKIISYNNRPNKTLKKLFYEHEVPPWQRDKVPLIYYKDQLICAVDVFSNNLLTKEELDIFYK